MRRSALLLAVLCGGCTPLPDAPEGLDEASSFLFREFFSDDATFEVGVQGFMDWFQNGGGEELVGLSPGADSEEPVDSFVVADLGLDDVVNYPYNGERMLGEALGVVSVAEMDCTWRTAETFLVRADQSAVFPETWEGYERTYTSSRERFEAGHESGYDVLPETITPFAEGFEAEPYEATLLFTENLANPSSAFGVDLDPYPLYLDFRHGRYAVEGEELGAFVISTHIRDPVVNEAGNGIAQTYSIEINVERPGNRTLRMLAVWAQTLTEGITITDELARQAAVRKALDSSNNLSEACAEVDQVEDSGGGCSVSASRSAAWWGVSFLPLLARRRRRAARPAGHGRGPFFPRTRAVANTLPMAKS